MSIFEGFFGDEDGVKKEINEKDSAKMSLRKEELDIAKVVFIRVMLNSAKRLLKKKNQSMSL